MTASTGTTWDTTAASPAFGVMYLIALEFSTGTVRVTNWPLDVVALGQTWVGLGTVAEVGELRESEDGNYQKLTLALTQVQSAYLALALGSPDTYQGRAASIYVALADAATLQVTGTPLLRFAGEMEQVRIERDDTGNGRVLLDLQTGAYDVRTNPAALRYSQAQHAARQPGETGFRYVQTLIGQPKQWLSVAFQKI